MSALDDELLAAHAAADNAALITLYTQAAEAAGDLDARCFYLTHALVFALEAGDGRAGPLRSQLVTLGRDSPD